VLVGVMDTGVNPTDVALDGANNSTHTNKIAWFKSYLSGGNQSANDVEGHGTNISELIAGDAVKPFSYSGGSFSFAGGVAPGAKLFEAQVCTATEQCLPNAQAYTDLEGQGVHLINESFDGGDITKSFSGPNDPNAQSYYQLWKPVVQAGVLQVFAAGNDGYANVGNFAGMPYLYPDLQPGFLAVVNIDVNADGTPGGLHTGTAPSDACGVAAQWCLAAPGTVYTLPSANYPGGLSTGTSNSAAVVTGVAAQVWQAFPWMTNGNVADTLLTTATDLGTPGVDSTYGWGLVNAAKAVKGPAQFAFGELDAAVPSGTTSTFANDISGSGSLNLTGAGSLILAGTDTYAGGSTVDAGSLVVNGSVSSDVAVNAGGTLGGTGTVKANVTSTGGAVMSASGTAGKGLTITGNYTEDGNSTTSVALGDPLNVGGAAAVAGTMEVLAAPSGYTVKSTENLLNAGSLSGTYASLVMGTGVFYTGTLAYTATQVNVNLVQASVTSVALSLPQATTQTRQSASNVQSALDVSNQWAVTGKTAGHEAWMNAAGAFLSAPTASAAVASLDSLSGEIYGTSRGIEAQQALFTDRALANRADELAHGGSAGVWVQGAGTDGTLSQLGYDDASYRASGLMAGVNGKLSDTFSGGIAAARTRVDSHLDALGGTIDGRETMLALYGRAELGDGAYLSGRVSHADVRSDVNRSVLLGTTLTPVSGDRTDHLTLATLEAGKAISSGDASWTPFASVAGLRINQTGFAENGAGGMGLAASSQDHTASFASLGARYSMALDWTGGHSWLTAWALYRRVLSGADLGMEASFAGVPDSTFVAEGQGLAKNTGMVGASFNTQVNAHWDWFLDADYQGSSGGSHAGEVDAGVRVSF
jgi:outer membrane autotransporter protein